MLTMQKKGGLFYARCGKHRSSGRLVTALTFRGLHPHFFAEASAIDLHQVHDRETLDAIRAGMDEYAVLIFRDQPFSDPEPLAFAQRFDGTLHTNTGVAVFGRNRFGNEVLTDISNVDEDGAILQSDDRRRTYAFGHGLWHSDASFQDPPGRYSFAFGAGNPPFWRRHGVCRYAHGV